MPFISSFALLVDAGGLLGLFPYRWNWRDNSMVFRQSWIWRMSHALWYSALTSYAVFLVYRTTQVFTNPTETPTTKAKMMYMTCLHIGLNFGFPFDLQGWGEHHLVFNQLLQYAAKFKRQHGVEMNGKRLKRFLDMNLFAWLFVTTHAFAVFKEPGSERLLTSLLYEETRGRIWIKCLFFCIHWMINAGQFYFLVFNAGTLLCYNFLLIPIIDRLNVYHDENGTLAPIQIQENAVRIAVLQSRYTVAYGSWLLLIIVWCISTIALNIFQVVAFQTVRPLFAGIMIGVLLASVCKNAGRLFERARDARDSWRGIRGVHWFQLSVRAYRPARVPLGSFFYFDRGIWPTIGDAILSTAANLIVSYSEE